MFGRLKLEQDLQMLRLPCLTLDICFQFLLLANILVDIEPIVLPS
jgi:hypothetical protein